MGTKRKGCQDLGMGAMKIQLVEADRGLLPAEVWSQILGFIGEWSDLKACRLTCKIFFTLCDHCIPTENRRRIILHEVVQLQKSGVRFTHTFPEDLILYYLYTEKSQFQALLQSQVPSRDAMEHLFWELRNRRSWFGHEHNNLGAVVKWTPFSDKRAYQLLRLITGSHHSRARDSHLTLKRLMKAHTLNKKKIVTECMRLYPIYFCQILPVCKYQQWKVLYSYVMGKTDVDSIFKDFVHQCFYFRPENQSTFELLQISEETFRDWKVDRLLRFMETSRQRTSRHFKLLYQIVEVIKAYILV